MNKEFAWFLGYLLSDGCILRPSYRNKGDETHLSFICKYDDREVLSKVKNILSTRSVVRKYPDYKSPQAQLIVYDRKDIINQYSDIKKKIPEEAIKGYERHFIRGCFDGDGTLSYRKSRGTFRIGFIDQEREITQWITSYIVNSLGLPDKICRWVPQNNVWEALWEGNMANLICWWLYHGDIGDCCLSRKRQKYIDYVLEGNKFEDRDLEILYTSRMKLDDRNEIMPSIGSRGTLEWCKRVANLLNVNATPVYHNKGTHKYYRLHVKDSNFVANMRDTQLF